MKTPLKFSRAFTLIEMLVVIVIIGIIMGIILPSLFNGRVKARDAKRISDIGQLQLALNLYYDKCKSFPNPTGQHTVDVAATTPCVASGNMSNYISVVPLPPTNPQLTTQPPGYEYMVDNTNSDYVLHVTLENQNDVQKDSISKTSWLGSGVYSNNSSYVSSANPPISCYDSSSSSSKDYCLGSK